MIAIVVTCLLLVPGQVKESPYTTVGGNNSKQYNNNFEEMYCSLRCVSNEEKHGMRHNINQRQKHQVHQYTLLCKHN